MKKFLLYIMVVAGMVSLQSCLHDDKDLFDESAAERLEQATEDTKQILESSESGWALQYYLGEEYSGAGCTYLVKFKDGKADVSLDLADPSEVSHSSYDVIKDQGPVLTFNTYNELMHKYAQPNTNGTTDGGDFEFMVMNVTNDVIDLKGRTTGNKMRLVRLPEGTDWEAYLNSISEFEENMFGSYSLMVDGNKHGVLTFDSDARQFEYVSGDSVDVTYPYCVTPNGVVLPEALAGNARDFTQATGDLYLTASDAADGKSVALEPFFTPDYVLRTLGGTVSMNDNAQSLDVKLKKANEYTYTTDADWLTVDANENGLTFKATANNEGHPRFATIKVANENGEDELTVAQVEFDKDIAGTYVLQYYDSDNTVAQNQFEVVKGSENEIDMPISIGRYTLHAKLTWNSETASFDWSSFQYLGQWSTYYVYNIFVGSQYWSAAKTDYTYSAPVNYDDENGTYAIFSEGQVAGGEKISYVSIQACDAYPATTDNFKGYLDLMSNIVLVKLPNDEMGAAKAKVFNNESAKVSKVLNRPAPSLYINPKFGKKLIK